MPSPDLRLNTVDPPKLCATNSLVTNPQDARTLRAGDRRPLIAVAREDACRATEASHKFCGLKHFPAGAEGKAPGLGY